MSYRRLLNVSGIEGMAFITLTDRDVVRHRLVQDIINAYSNHETEQDRQANNREQESVQ